MTKDHNIISLITKAIEQADKSYFFEDYTSQAVAVMDALKKAGYNIVPTKPNDKMIKSGVAAIIYGRSKPSDIVREVYNAMVVVGSDLKDTE
ncbi:MAG: hypothetical protein K0Q51_914 [Rickettsiaceae bacterium]|jgi:hypothetical protein|nr:hypothetical protein [Rickettsiaceae bacterium]